MTFFCNGCEQDKDFTTEFSVGVISNNITNRFCRTCRNGSINSHDVYWDGKPEINLADDPLTEKPREFLSKGHKAAYLRDRGLMEAGDRYHGAPVSFYKNQERKAVNSRNEVRSALKKVKEMGRDRRRYEYLKIVKEGRERAGSK